MPIRQPDSATSSYGFLLSNFHSPTLIQPFGYLKTSLYCARHNLKNSLQAGMMWQMVLLSRATNTHWNLNPSHRRRLLPPSDRISNNVCMCMYELGHPRCVCDNLGKVGSQTTVSLRCNIMTMYWTTTCFGLWWPSSGCLGEKLKNLL